MWSNLLVKISAKRVHKYQIKSNKTFFSQKNEISISCSFHVYVKLFYTQKYDWINISLSSITLRIICILPRDILANVRHKKIKVQINIFT
jgi:hypothetical protein